MPTPHVSIIVPSQQELPKLRALIPCLCELMKDRGCFEILIVDNDSTDGTEAFVRGYASLGAPISLLVRENGRGHGAAVAFGLRRARGLNIVCIAPDAAAAAPAMIDMLSALDQEGGPEFVLASRRDPMVARTQSQPLHIWLNQKISQLLYRPLASSPVGGSHLGFFAVKRQVVARCQDLHPIGDHIALEIIAKCACNPVLEIAVDLPRIDSGRAWPNLDSLNQISRLYDFRYPRLAASVKFLVGALLAYGASILTFALLPESIANIRLRLLWAQTASIAVVGLFYWRYVFFNRPFFRAASPMRDFLLLSVTELALVTILLWMAPLNFDADPALLLLVIAGAGLITRFVGRKLLGHDLRGPELVRDLMERYRYQDQDLQCPFCHCRYFSLPFVWRYPWLVRCSHCSVAMVHPQPTNEQLSQHYSGSYFAEWGTEANESALRRVKILTFLDTIRPLQRLTKINTFLDVGCGLGYGLDAARELGWEAYGIDINPTAVAKINERHPGRAACMDAEALSSSGRRFDMISLFDVLEHVRDPASLLRRLRAMMTEESLVVTSTIDILSKQARRLGHRWFHFQKAHLWYFTKSSLVDLFSNCGFEVISLCDGKKRYTLRYIFGNLRARDLGPFLNRIFDGILKHCPRYVLDLALPPLKEGVVVVAKPRPERAAVTRYLQIEQ